MSDTKSNDSYVLATELAQINLPNATGYTVRVEVGSYILLPVMFPKVMGVETERPVINIDLIFAPTIELGRVLQDEVHDEIYQTRLKPQLLCAVALAVDAEYICCVGTGLKARAYVPVNSVATSMKPLLSFNPTAALTIGAEVIDLIGQGTINWCKREIGETRVGKEL